MNWNNIEPEIQQSSIRELFEIISPIDFIKECYCKSVPLLIIRESALCNIYKHITRSNNEMGGLLIGSVYSRKDLKSGILAIEIKKAIPSSEDFSSSAVSLNMGTMVWNETRKHTTSKNIVVGWFHSHPNLGAFFSGTDKRTQKGFFYHPYSIGFVADQIRKEERCFIGKESKEIPKWSIL